MKKLILFFVGFYCCFCTGRIKSLSDSTNRCLNVKYFSTNNYDIASVRPGEYLDLVVTTSEFQNLVDIISGFIRP